MRCFVAILPPVEVRVALAGVLDGRALPRGRGVPAENLHLTLVFIGDVHAKALRDVKESVERSASGVGAFTLRVNGLVTIPTPEDGGPPRLIAARTDAPAGLLEAQRRLVTRLARPKKNGRFTRFLPHVTLYRYAHGASSDAFDDPLDGPSFTVDRIVLMESRQTAAGGVYVPVHDALL